GIPRVIIPPGTGFFSNTTGLYPSIARKYAQDIPAGPEPMMAIFWSNFSLVVETIGGTYLCSASRSLAAINCLMSSIARDSSMLPLVHSSSQYLQQIAPQTAGNGLSFLISS